MSKTRNPDALIRIGDAINVLCCKRCYPGPLCPDSYCVEMWDKFEDVERIDAVPVKHGRWKMVEGELSFWDMCSECGRKILHRTPYYDFCPNCGARMDGDHEKLRQSYGRQWITQHPRNYGNDNRCDSRI